MLPNKEEKGGDGVDYIPTVPEDIKAWEDEQIGIYKRDGGIGEVYWDADIMNYAYRLETASIQNAQAPKSVILSGASAESKKLRTYGTFAGKSLRRSFDSLRKSLIFFGHSG